MSEDDDRDLPRRIPGKIPPPEIHEVPPAPDLPAPRRGDELPEPRPSSE